MPASPQPMAREQDDDTFLPSATLVTSIDP